MKNSQAVKLVQSLKAWVKKVVKSKVAAKNNHKDVTDFWCLNNNQAYWLCARLYTQFHNKRVSASGWKTHKIKSL